MMMDAGFTALCVSSPCRKLDLRSITVAARSPTVSPAALLCVHTVHTGVASSGMWKTNISSEKKKAKQIWLFEITWCYHYIIVCVFFVFFCDSGDIVSVDISKNAGKFFSVSFVIALWVLCCSSACWLWVPRAHHGWIWRFLFLFL